MKQYLELLKEVRDKGVWKEPARTGLPRTKEIFCRTMEFDLTKGFPLMTTKRMYIRGFVAELLWLLRGETNIKPLVDQNVHVWDKDAYRFYKLRGGKLSQEEWLKLVKDKAWDYDAGMVFGDLGKVYGYQWRCFRGQYDQIEGLIKGLKERPNSRYHLVTAWDPVDFFHIYGIAALPACHMTFQCCVTNGYLDIMMLQRSCDMVLGVPFDIAEYALLCHILAAEVGLKPGKFTWVGNSIHIYENHLAAVDELLKREPLPLCTLEIREKKPFDKYEVEDFRFVNYKSHSPVKAKLNVGI